MQLHRLRVLRAEKNITQLELARRLGWPAGRLWKIEHRYRDATAEERAALAAFFNVTEDAIWGAANEAPMSHACASVKDLNHEIFSEKSGSPVEDFDPSAFTDTGQLGMPPTRCPRSHGGGVDECH